MSESGKQALLLIAVVVCLVLIIQPNTFASLTKRTEVPRRVLSQAEMQLFTTTANTGEIVMVGANGVLIDQGSQAIRVGTDAVSVFAGGNERIRISNTGNVGIGTTDPVDALHIESINTWNTIRLGKVITEPDLTYVSQIVKPTSWISYAKDQTGKNNLGGDFFVQMGGLSHFSWNAWNYAGSIVLRSGNIWSRGNNGSSTTGHEVGGDVYIDSGAVHALNTNGDGPYKRGGDIYLRTGNVRNFSTVAEMDATSVDWTPRLFVNGKTGIVGINTTYGDGDLNIGASNPAVSQNTYITIGNVGMGTAANTTTYGLERSRCELRFRSWRDSSPSRIGAKIVSISKQTSGYLDQHLVQSSDLLFCTAPPYGRALGYDETSERMRITDTGNVGIGTTNPQYTLHVVGGARITSFIHSAFYQHSYYAGNNVWSPGDPTDWPWAGRVFYITFVGEANRGSFCTFGSFLVFHTRWSAGNNDASSVTAITSRWVRLNSITDGGMSFYFDSPSAQTVNITIMSIAG